MTVEVSRERRAAVHAALADPRRLQVVDELAMSDRSPSELAVQTNSTWPAISVATG